MRTAPIRSSRALGDGLREFRLAAGRTQRELAAELGVSQHLIAELETGKSTKAIDRLLAYLRAVNARMVIEGAPDA